MTYEILSDEVKEKNNKSSNSKKNFFGKKGPKKKFFKKGIDKKLAFKIHLTIIILLILLVGIFLVMYFINNGYHEVELEGEVEEFKQDFNGNLVVESSSFSINTDTGNFDGSNEVINLENSSGNVELKDNKFVFSGNAESINYGGNTITLDNENFELISEDKTKFEKGFDELNLTLSHGELKLGGDRLKHSFTKSDLYAKDFDTEIIFSDKLSFKGDVEQLYVDSKEEENIIIHYGE